MTLGKFVYKYLFKPTLPIRYNLDHFGLKGWFNIWKGEREMKRAASTLPPLQLDDEHVLECSYLTGEKYWHQTIFCAYSLAKVTACKVKINIYSDGSLSDKHISLFRKVLKGITIVSTDEVLKQIEKKFPFEKYPSLRYLRDSNPFFRKLVDLRLNENYLVQLDSDMLFFNTPHDLISAYNTSTSYFMEDKIPASYYVLPEHQVEAEFKFKMKEKINSGILAYNSAAIEWDFVEQVCVFLMDKVSNIHPPMFEQTINAIIVSKLNAQPLNEFYNILYSSESNLTNANDVVRHYIFKAKPLYFQSEWKKIK